MRMCGRSVSVDADAAEIQAIGIGRRCVGLLLDVAACVTVIAIAISIAGIHLVVNSGLASIASS